MIIITNRPCVAHLGQPDPSTNKPILVEGHQKIIPVRIIKIGQAVKESLYENCIS